MMRFPLRELLSEQACYDYLMQILHPEGLQCPNGHPLPKDQAPHDRHRAPIVDYRCRRCGRVFNLFTGTIWQGTRLSCAAIVLLLRGIVQGVSTRQLAEELDVGYETLLRWRHRLQAMGLAKLPTDPLPDAEVESDEMFQNAGEKGTPHRDPADPPADGPTAGGGSGR
ncbi:MAG TPA: helix-turn-helix domain-containing protein [Thermoflexus sp.]|nr:helix-turn-helix domain-containing protein [Thermoflexus sp.]